MQTAHEIIQEADAEIAYATNQVGTYEKHVKRINNTCFRKLQEECKRLGDKENKLTKPITLNLRTLARPPKADWESRQVVS